MICRKQYVVNNMSQIIGRKKVREVDKMLRMQDYGGAVLRLKM